jgi:hypothetical protein
MIYVKCITTTTILVGLFFLHIRVNAVKSQVCKQDELIKLFIKNINTKILELECKLIKNMVNLDTESKELDEVNDYKIIEKIDNNFYNNQNSKWFYYF